MEDLHVYLRTVAHDERTSLSVLASLVHPQASVLDLGCGSGSLGQFLSETKGCTLDGVTLSEAEADHARPHYRRVVVDNLETCDLIATFEGQRYDYIVCADVLEHLSRPEKVLAACRQLLTPQGRLLISVPNAGYIGLVAELLEGEFLYRDEGLLDRTHLRFFTRRSLSRFLGAERWAIDAMDTIVRELPESEFNVAFDRLPPAVSRHLLGAPDALTYQFICVAQPTASAQAEALPTTPPAERAHARFSAELYLGHSGQYAEDRKLTAAGVIGQERQLLRFDLSDQAASLSQLRLDPADRPGFLHLYALRLVSNATAQPLWQWSSDTQDRSLLAATAHSQIVWQAPLPAAAGATLMLLAGDEPWFELPIPPALLAAAPRAGLQLEVELGWPMSADYVALANTVLPLHDQIEQLHAKARAIASELDNARSEIGLEQQRYQQLTEAKRQVEDALTLLTEKNEASTAQRVTWQQEATRVQRDFDELAHHLKAIESSTVFRATRPIVHAKMKLDRLLGRAPAAVQPAPIPEPMAAPAHPVDIIVPVYRGLADTELCINSVLASQNTCDWRLIVINDASPEPEVTQWLRERAASEPRITLLENPENLGFVGTVNRGMAHSTSNDVLLLNSDTEVANDWLDRIRRAAYGDRKIASVTPLSTNATICSYPRFCEDNPLPPGYSTAKLDALCAATNPGVAVDVPTGVGFCMYIRRDSLTEVGLFDTENFGKGYGEENDFCQRAAKAGWRNLHLLDTFVLHTGGVSFGDSKSPREKAAMETLRRLHPRYEAEVMKFVQADPARPYRLALDAARIAQSGLPVVLAVLHDRAGGTLRHVRELAEHLSEHAVFLTLTPAPGRSVSLQLAREGEGFELQFRMEDQFIDLIDALRQLGVQHVHYHHLLGHEPTVTDLPAQLGVAYDFTAHDFYSYCTHISLTGNDNRYVPEVAPGQCACCKPGDPAPVGGGSITDWRHRNNLFLSGARTVLAPSLDAARRIAGLAPTAKVRAVPHTDIQAHGDAALEALAVQAPAQPRAADAPLKVVVLGALSAIKGADLLEAVALEAAKRNAPIEFHLLGYGYRHLQTQPRAALSVHGAYKEEELPRLLAWLKPDLVWFPAQWPETYSYTLSAALQAGLPVLAPDLGAFPERLEGRAWSWIEPWDCNSADCLAQFLALRSAHFASGQPPQPPAAPSAAATHATARAVLQGDWHYDQQYLRDLPAVPPAAGLTLDFIATHTPQAPAGAAGAKSALLSTAVYLRSHPLLRGVAQRVPQHWQTRIKNWLRG